MTLHNLKLKRSNIWSLSLLLLILCAGCSVPKNVTYFQDLSEEVVTMPNTGEIRIEPNDKLSITVKTMDPSLSALFNLSVYADRTGDGEIFNQGAGTLRNSMATSSGISKYTVSPQGTIDFPLLGELKVEGMTRSELSGFIKGEIMGRDLAKDPVVTVEFVNLGVSLLGEVNSPGLYSINKDRLNILEALSMAGDLTILGQRDNVAVVREKDGKIETYRLDLTNFKELSQSPAYYIKQGDIVYVEPNNNKKRQTTTNGNNLVSTSFWVSVASLLTSVVTTIGVFVVK